MNNTITLGADPEFFLMKAGKFRSSIGLIGGSKACPAPLGRDGFAIQEDNVAVEFNVPPTSDIEEWTNNMEWVIKEIGDKLRSHDFAMAWEASALFDPEELVHPMALVFGCDPDFNAWYDGKVNPKPKANDLPNLRTCGGHVHIGYPEKESREFRLRLIQAADMFLGVPSVRADNDARRAKLYGKAGAFRPTPYGAEYRVLSNFWLQTRARVRWVFNAMNRAYNYIQDPKNIKTLDDNADVIQRIINERSQVDADVFCSAHKIAYVP